MPRDVTTIVLESNSTRGFDGESHSQNPARSFTPMQRAKTHFIALKIAYPFLVWNWKLVIWIYAAAEALLIHCCWTTLLGRRSKASPWGHTHTLLTAKVSPGWLPLSGFSFFLTKSLQTTLKKAKTKTPQLPKCSTENHCHSALCPHTQTQY